MDEDTKVCPVCGETIKAVALKCRFCNTDLGTFAATKEQEVERELFSGHPAVIYTASQIFPFLLAAAVAAAFGYFATSDPLGYFGGSDRGIIYACLIFLVLCVAIYFFYYLKSLRVRYKITTQRIKMERGVLSKVEESLELFRIDHFELRKPIGKRIMGQASLHLFSSDAELESFSIYGVPNLEALADTLRDCQLRERARRNLTTFVKA